MSMSSIKRMGASLGFAVALALSTTATVADTRNTLLPDGYQHYVPGIVPERIVLVPTATPENSQTVNWRTDSNLSNAAAEISRAVSHPGLHVAARAVRGQTSVLNRSEERRVGKECRS